MYIGQKNKLENYATVTQRTFALNYERRYLHFYIIIFIFIYIYYRNRNDCTFRWSMENIFLSSKIIY